MDKPGLHPAAPGLHPAAKGWQAVVRNWRPFLLIQCLAVVVAVLYYNVEGFAVVCERVATVKASGGLGFSGLSTVVASILVPELARVITRVKSPLTLSGFTFQVGFFFFAGCLIDLFYQFLGSLLGDGATWTTVLSRVVVDQFIFSPLVSIPITTVAFLWRDRGFNGMATMASIREGEIGRRYPSVLVTCWGFWLPTLLAVFAMPLRLQFSLFLLTQGAWSLLLVYVNTAETES